MQVRFVWDPNKAESNLRKHGVSFPLASLVFVDPLRSTELDRVEDGEQRWLTIGEVAGNRILVVVHTVTDDEYLIETIRIISARKAGPLERRRYERSNDEI